MSTSIEDRSLRKQTGSIRRLDAARAREIVALFARPIVGSDGHLSLDREDSIRSAACGWVTLDRPADDSGSAVVVGSYKTHLYLDGLERLPLSMARQLVRHRRHPRHARGGVALAARARACEPARACATAGEHRHHAAPRLRKPTQPGGPL